MVHKGPNLQGTKHLWTSFCANSGPPPLLEVLSLLSCSVLFWTQEPGNPGRCPPDLIMGTGLLFLNSLPKKSFFLQGWDWTMHTTALGLSPDNLQYWGTTLWWCLCFCWTLTCLYMPAFPGLLPFFRSPPFSWLEPSIPKHLSWTELQLFRKIQFSVSIFFKKIYLFT